MNFKEKYFTYQFGDKVVKHFKDILRNLIPTIALYGDSRDDEFSVKRGTQTIKEK